MFLPSFCFISCDTIVSDRRSRAFSSYVASVTRLVAPPRLANISVQKSTLQQSFFGFEMQSSRCVQMMFHSFAKGWNAKRLMMVEETTNKILNFHVQRRYHFHLSWDSLRISVHPETYFFSLFLWKIKKGLLITLFGAKIQITLC